MVKAKSRGLIIEQSNSSGKNKCLDGLDEQPPKSVMYFFGTTCSMSEEHINELAVRLEESKMRFIRVLRYADREHVFAVEDQSLKLPEGFEERTGGARTVTREWVPHAEILRHPSIACFMSHCRLGSCLESISIGAPIAV
ncbi:hypothetical protein SLA2020_191190 [Shorea laevis]